MLVGISGLDVGFASAIVGGVVGVASPLSAAIVATWQRKDGINARVYIDKRDAYRAVARDAYKGRELLWDCRDDLKEADDARARERISKLKDDISELNSAESEVLTNFAVIASDSVRKEHDAWVGTWNETVNPLWDLADGNESGFANIARVHVQRAIEAWGDAMEKLRDAMRDDLCA